MASEAWFQQGTQERKLLCVCGIPGHSAKDCSRKEIAQCSMRGAKVHLDTERETNGGKHESVAMGPTLSTPDEEYWAALTLWNTAGMLVYIGCTDNTVTISDALPDAWPFTQFSKTPTERLPDWSGEAVLESANIPKKGNNNANARMFSVCLNILIPPISLKTHRVGRKLHFREKT